MVVSAPKSVFGSIGQLNHCSLKELSVIIECGAVTLEKKLIMNSRGDDGIPFSYSTISSKMNTTKPLTDQLDLLLGAVMLLLFGTNNDTVLFRNMVTWGYK